MVPDFRTPSPVSYRRMRVVVEGLDRLVVAEGAETETLMEQGVTQHIMDVAGEGLATARGRLHPVETVIKVYLF